MRYREASAYSSFSIPHLEAAAYSGALKSHGDGKRRRFHRDDLDAWVKEGGAK
jgi:excisionase family DNA binding protein